MQSNSYTNSCFSICAARAGYDDGRYGLIGGSCIIDPQGNIIAEARTIDDEIIVANCDLDLCKPGKTRTFDFARHRRPEHYGLICSQTGVLEPRRLSRPSSSVQNGYVARHARVLSGGPSKAQSNGNTNGVHRNSGSNHLAHQASTSGTLSDPVTANDFFLDPSNQIHILLINPTSSKSITETCLKTI